MAITDFIRQQAEQVAAKEPETKQLAPKVTREVKPKAPAPVVTPERVKPAARVPEPVVNPRVVAITKSLNKIQSARREKEKPRTSTVGIVRDMAKSAMANYEAKKEERSILLNTRINQLKYDRTTTPKADLDAQGEPMRNWIMEQLNVPKGPLGDYVVSYWDLKDDMPEKIEQMQKRYREDAKMGETTLTKATPEALEQQKFTRMKERHQSFMQGMWDKNNWIAEKLKVPKDPSGKPLVSLDEIKKSDPGKYDKLEKEYEKTKRVAAFVGMFSQAFSEDLEKTVGTERLGEMETSKAIGDSVSSYFSSMLLDTVDFEKLQNMGRDVYFQNGEMYYKGVPVDKEFLTAKGEKASTIMDTTAAFLGAAPAYMGIAGAITKGVKGLAASKSFPKIANVFQKFLKFEKKYPVLAEVLGYNVAEELTEVGLRKGLGQEYTFSNFLQGLAFGGVIGGTMVKIGNVKVKAEDVNKILKEAEDVYKKTGDLEAVKEIPIANTTVGGMFKEQRMAHLKGMQDPKVRAGIEAAAPLPKPKAEIAPELKPLMEEAKKYKSAEDFVEAQEVLYRGGEKLDLAKIDEQGISLSRDKEVAEVWKGSRKGGVLEEFVITPGSKIYKPKLPDRALTFQEKQAFTSEARKGGYDILDMSKGGEKEMVIFDSKSIQTKQQLTDIYNQSKTPTGTLKTDDVAWMRGTKEGGSKPEVVKTKPRKKAPQLESRVYERLKDEIPENIREEVGYKEINLKEDAKKAMKLLETDKAKAYNVAMGLETAPRNQTSTAVNIALAEKALSENNHGLYSTLVKNRSLAQTKRGQEIVAEKGSVTNNSTSRYVKELLDARMNKLGEGYTAGIDKLKKVTPKEKAIKRIGREVEKVEKAIKKTKEMDIVEAQKLIDSLICK